MDRLIFHVCISGFRQSEARCHGLLRLSERLIRDGHNHTRSRVILKAWNDDWTDFAEYVWLLTQHYSAEAVVAVYAYSWGMGWGAMRLCEELGERGIEVGDIVSIDGVYRHPNPLLRWTSLLHRDRRLAPVIRIPANVHRVHCFHQTQNTPQGHRIVPGSNCKAEIAESVEVHADHSYIDENHMIHDICRLIAGSQADPGPESLVTK